MYFVDQNYHQTGWKSKDINFTETFTNQLELLNCVIDSNMYIEADLTTLGRIIRNTSLTTNGYLTIQVSVLLVSYSAPYYWQNIHGLTTIIASVPHWVYQVFVTPFSDMIRC